jgi:hypothetical protein
VLRVKVQSNGEQFRQIKRPLIHPGGLYMNCTMAFSEKRIAF